MQKISKLILKNFKFFYGEFSVEFERKNILLYGENGSGKSSIYWALYTFLQSVFKTDNSEIKKYFEHGNGESLINRFADDNAESSIVLELEDGRGIPSAREISFTNINISETESDKLILETTLGSDFIDHKVLSRIYAYYHKEEIDLFDFFCHHLLSFINFREEMIKPGESNGSKNAETWWDYISEGLTPRPKMHEHVYRNFQEIIRKFNIEFDYYLKKIEQTTNEYLRDRFEEKFKIKFEYRNATYNDFKLGSKGRSWKIKAPRVIMSVRLITDLIANQDRKTVSSPQSFLNEAKLSALALAMRLAILDEKFVAKYPKILVLDDVLLSMDMSNREFFLNIILENYLKDYQILFFTHQRGLFEDARKFIESYHARQAQKAGGAKGEIEKAWEKHWIFFEMYETENESRVPIPKIQMYGNSLQKAFYYFKEHIDYSACGNNLRAALEEFFREFIPENNFRDKKGGQIPREKLMLNRLLEIAESYFASVNYDLAPLVRLNMFREQSLNPASHYNPRADFYKKELREIFLILDLLKTNKRIPVIKMNEQIKFEIKTKSGKVFAYEATLLEDLNAYNKNGEDSNYYVLADIIHVVFISCLIDSVPKAAGQDIKGTLQQIYSQMIPFVNGSEVAIEETDMYKVFTNKDGSTLEQLKQLT